MYRANNTAANLAEIFKALKERYLSLDPVTPIKPVFAPKPALNPQGLLHPEGNFPTQPLQVNFSLDYQPAPPEGCRLFSISVRAAKPPV